jgi:hypothetical protein
MPNSPFGRGRIRLLKQAYGGVREIHPRFAHHENPVLAIVIEDIATHVGMGGLLDGESEQPNLNVNELTTSTQAPEFLLRPYFDVAKHGVGF